MIKFGPSGNSASFYLMGYKHTEQAPEYLDKFNLDCFEYSFGRGIMLSADKAVKIGRAFAEAEVKPQVKKSYGYVLDSAKYLKLLGGKRLVFHPAAQGKASRGEAVSRTADRLKVLRDMIYENGLEDLMFCPETMGKLAQIGTLEEIVEFCKTDRVFTPAIDFGHINAREQGSLKTEEDYLSRLTYMAERLGREKMARLHIHFSKIEYTEKGEKRHLTFEDEKYGPEFLPLAKALKKLNLEPYIVCESAGTQDKDALEMKKIYFSLA